MKKALRDLSRHWRKKVLHAWLTIKHPIGDTSHGDIVWGCSRTCCLSTIPFLQQHPRGENQDDLPHRPCLAQVLHPIHPSIPGTARAPLLLQLRLSLDDDLLIIFPDHSESKPQCLAEQSSEASPGQTTQLQELPGNRMQICSLQLGRRNVDVQQIKSCVNKILWETSPSH